MSDYRYMELSGLTQSMRADADGFVRETDADFDVRLDGIARHICENRDEKPVVLLCGPSGSGKTTVALMLRKIFAACGVSAYALSLDNYYRPLGETQSGADGVDLESPTRVDADFLNAQLADMIAGRRVELPRYDFVQARRVQSGDAIARKTGDLIVLEGTHALNPDVVRLPDAACTRLYVSVCTGLCVNGTRLEPPQLRLMRRILRDRLFRGRAIGETIEMFRSVQAGERRFIAPYKARADLSLDTFIAYEPFAYARLLSRELPDAPPSPEKALLTRIAADIAPMDSARVPKTSLIREFLGDGQFDY